MHHSKFLLALALTGCAGLQAGQPAPDAVPAVADSAEFADTRMGALSEPGADPFVSTYEPFASRPTVIRNVNIFTAAGPLIRNGAILMVDGKVAEIGSAVSSPASSSARQDSNTDAFASS